MKIAGAAYLVALGIWTLVARRAESDVALGGERDLRRAFAQGVVVNVLNPKPRSSSSRSSRSSSSSPAVQLAVLGLLFAALGLVTDSAWALVAGAAGGMLRRSRAFVRAQRYVTGGVYVGLGVATALAGGDERG